MRLKAKLKTCKRFCCEVLWLWVYSRSQRLSDTKQICLVDEGCGIPVIRFALYYTCPLMPCYQILSTMITKTGDLQENMCPVACSLFGVMAQIGAVVNTYY